jgi:hypothetical protein
MSRSQVPAAGYPEKSSIICSILDSFVFLLFMQRYIPIDWFENKNPP